MPFGKSPAICHLAEDKIEYAPDDRIRIRDKRSHRELITPRRRFLTDLGRDLIERLIVEVGERGEQMCIRDSLYDVRPRRSHR